MPDTDAFHVEPGSAGASVLLTCEHASERLPEPWRWPEGDRRLAGTHWAYDLGAADLCLELARATGATAVLSRFSRLLADPNRPEDSPELFRAAAEGAPVLLNASLAPEDRERRLALWQAYHAAVDREVERSSATVLLAVHTFTPLYEGTRRTIEAGVLFDDEEALAEELRRALAAAGFVTALNEPYSGKAGLLYSVERHARRHRRKAVEIELRQDLAVDASCRRRVTDALAGFFGRAPGAGRP